MQDRFSDLLNLMGKDTQPSPWNSEQELGSVTDPFFADVRTIEDAMGRIAAHINFIKTNHVKALATISSEQSQAMSGQVHNSMLAVQQESTNIRALLTRMAQSNQNTPHTANTRIRANFHNTLTQKFVKLMHSFEELQTKCKDEIETNVKRQMRIVNPNATEDQVNHLIDTYGHHPQVFSSAILDGARHQAAKEAVSYVQSKHHEILYLEQSIMELHSLFQDMAHLVNTQGEIIDNIEKNVTDAASHVEAGNNNMVIANKRANSARKKTCCIAIIVVVVLVVLLLPLIRLAF